MDHDADNLAESSRDSGAAGQGRRQIKLAGIRAAYVADLPPQIEVLKSLSATGDFAGVKKHAHRIKGTSGTYRLFDIADAMEDVEEFADRGDTASIQHKLDELGETMKVIARQTQQACDALTKERSQ